jgi:hypothetical protein
MYAVYDGKYYYNARCIIAAKSALCIDGWRVPTASDAESLTSDPELDVTAPSRYWGPNAAFGEGENAGWGYGVLALDYYNAKYGNIGILIYSLTAITYSNGMAPEIYGARLRCVK